MKIKLNEFYDMPAVAYSLYFFTKDNPLTKDEYLDICEKIRYYAKKSGVSWLCVYSTTERDSAEQVIVRTGKRGRPRKLIKGEKIGGHCHNVLVGNREQSAYGTAYAIKRALDKKYKRPICQVHSKGDCDHALEFINYCYAQADIVRSGGNFDFKEHAAKYNFFSKKDK